MFHHVRTLRLIWLRYSLASVAIISLAAPLTKAGQQQPAQGQSYLVPTTSSAPNTNTEPMMPMPLVFPLFIEDRHFTSTLVMINGLSVSTFADVTLRDLNGAEISRQRIDFEPHSQQRLEVSKALLVAGSRATIGSIVLTEPSDRAGTAILAQLTMTYTGLAGPNYLDEEASMPDSGGSQILRGVTGESKGSPIVSIVSLSDVPQNVTIQCLSRFGVTFSKSVHLFTKETIL